MLWKKLRKIPKNNGVIGHRKCPEIRKGARQKWFKFGALWFWRHIHDYIWREQKHVCPAWREIEAATSVLNTTLSSQVGSIVCCAAVWFTTWHSQMDFKKVRLIFCFRSLVSMRRSFSSFFEGFLRKAKSYDHRGVSRLLLGEARR